MIVLHNWDQLKFSSAMKFCQYYASEVDCQKVERCSLGGLNRLETDQNLKVRLIHLLGNLYLGLYISICNNL